jgi:hypothetical protein
VIKKADLKNSLKFKRKSGKIVFPGKSGYQAQGPTLLMGQLCFTPTNIWSRRALVGNCEKSIFETVA